MTVSHVVDAISAYSSCDSIKENVFLHIFTFTFAGPSQLRSNLALVRPSKLSEFDTSAL